MRVNKLSLPALLAALFLVFFSGSALGSISLNNSRSNAYRIQGEIQTEVSAVDAQLAALQQQMADLEAHRAKLESLKAELDAALADAATEDAGLQEQYDQAAQLFSEQIAPLLSPESAASVSAELEAQRQSAAAGASPDAADTSSEVTDGLENLGSLIGELKTALDQAKQGSGSLDTAVKASWNLKENVK